MSVLPQRTRRDAEEEETMEYDDEQYLVFF